MNGVQPPPAPDRRDIPRVIAPPPLIYLAGILIGILLHFAFPVRVLPRGPATLFGVLLVAAGIALMALSLREFSRAGTSIRVDEPTSTVVMTGPYRFSRNPIYVSMAIGHLGIGLWVNSAWIVAMLVPVLLIISTRVIAREERYLERRFGEDYLRYKRSVRRWF